ncbi:hypothetical protein FS749_002741 [Ceratobasidium sp. UAMH 11750]|nr:hypothetical protein FS749_002741 [Ceratobasidium sp. UAMH 11750]
MENVKEVTLRYKPRPVAVLALHLPSRDILAGNIVNCVIGNLSAYDVPFSSHISTIERAIQDTDELVEWLLTNVTCSSLFLCIIVTETTSQGYWFRDQGGSHYAMTEIDLLKQLFVDDPQVHQLIFRTRVPVLFLVSCGGNLTDETVDRLDRWNCAEDESNERGQCFTHMIAFASTRLRPAEITGFFCLLAQRAYAESELFHRAVTHAWCRSEQMRHHSGLVWFSTCRKPFLLRLHTHNNPFGTTLPDLNEVCCCKDRGRRWRITKWKESEYSYVSTCCKARLKVTVPHGVKRLEEGGAGYMLEPWPGNLASLEIRRKGEAGGADQDDTLGARAGVKRKRSAGGDAAETSRA